MDECLLGSILVPDIANPRPEDVDLRFMRLKLGELRRFSGNPAALSVAEHQIFCAMLAVGMGLGGSVVEWAEHHDCHEYATGDLATPLQRVIGTERLHLIQQRWDVAIACRLGILEPTDSVRARVALVDRVALAAEWTVCLGRHLGELGVSVEAEALERASRILIGSVLADGRREEITEARAFLKMGVAS